MYLCYTDGGCRVSERSPGGWGVYIRPPKGEPIEQFGGALDTNSTTMELTAVKVALGLLPQGAKATVFSDSQEVLSYCEKSIPIWRENGWKNLPSQFESMLREINSYLEEKNLKITWTWIRSHNGNPGNERADQLADHGARDAKKLIKKERKL
ncbi:MAG: RNase H family protein [Bacteriovorax sp.]